MSAASADDGAAVVRDEVEKALAWHRGGGMRPNCPPDLAGCPVGALKALARMVRGSATPPLTDERAREVAEGLRTALAYIRAVRDGRSLTHEDSVAGSGTITAVRAAMYGRQSDDIQQLERIVSKAEAAFAATPPLTDERVREVADAIHECAPPAEVTGKDQPEGDRR